MTVSTEQLQADDDDVSGITSPIVDELEDSKLPQQILGSAYEPLQLFHQKLMREGEARGIIGPRDTPILWERHILNSAAVIPFIVDSLDKQRHSHGIADLGSGGGFPGIVIAACLPDVPVTLIEPMERRIQWLNEVVELMQLKNVSLLRARAEDLTGPQQGLLHQSSAHASKQQSVSGAMSMNQTDKKNFTFSVVTCRAVAPMRKLAPIALPLLVPGGQLIALKGRTASIELEKAQSAIKKAKGIHAQVCEAAVGTGLEDTHVVIVSKR